MKKNKCPECSGEIVKEYSVTYCRKCGLVIVDEKIVFNDNSMRANGSINSRANGKPSCYLYPFSSTTIPY